MWAQDLFRNLLFLFTIGLIVGMGARILFLEDRTLRIETILATLIYEIKEKEETDPEEVFSSHPDNDIVNEDILISPNALEESEKPKKLTKTHLKKLPWEKLKEIATSHGLCVIEEGKDRATKATLIGEITRILNL